MIMMTRCKRILAAVLCLAALLSGLALPTEAAGGLDISKTVSLAIKHKYAVEDLSFSVYRIAQLQSDGTLKALPPFEKYVKRILATQREADWVSIAWELEQDGETLNKAEVKTAATNSKGTASITGLKPGLYLIGSTRKVGSGKIYVTDASLITLPRKDNRGWSCDVVVNAKADALTRYQDLKVVKVWKDACHPERRPTSITIRLLRDGEVFDKVVLPKNGKWSYTWEHLDMTHEWTVEEERVTGYRNPTVTFENGVFTVTNTCSRPGTHYNTRLPQTGQLWWPVPVLLAGGLMLVIIGLVRRREDDYEER